MWGIFGNPLKRAIQNTLGLHAVLTTCLRFSSFLDSACVACCLLLPGNVCHVFMVLGPVLQHIVTSANFARITAMHSCQIHWCRSHPSTQRYVRELATLLPKVLVLDVTSVAVDVGAVNEENLWHIALLSPNSCIFEFSTSNCTK